MMSSVTGLKQGIGTTMSTSIRLAKLIPPPLKSTSLVNL